MTEDEADLFQTWIGNRDQARRKMKLLSHRETQVVSLVAEGLPNKTIARELDLSTKTIETRQKRIIEIDENASKKRQPKQFR